MPGSKAILVNFAINYHIVKMRTFFQGVSSGGIISLADADLQTSGAKAASCGRLASLATVSSKGSKLMPETKSLFEKMYTCFFSTLCLYFWEKYLGL